MHICDNPKCINPDHLKAGTFKENSQDMSRKGRAGAMKLPRSVYPIIEEMLAAGFFQADVAAMFDVTQPTISAIHRRST
jgi:predicted XRE-type DNA-binding protein